MWFSLDREFEYYSGSFYPAILQYLGESMKDKTLVSASTWILFRECKGYAM
jgi:hypothetical protein